MTLDEIKELAGYREVSPWVIKLVQDAVELEREKAAKVCDEYGNSVNNDWNKQLGVADDLVSIAEECATAIRSMK